MRQCRDNMLDALYENLVARVDELAGRLVTAVAGHEEGSRVAGAPPAELHRSCREDLLTTLQLLGDAGCVPLATPRAVGRRRAEQRIPLDAVLRSVRLGGRVIWEELTRAARRAGPDATDAVLDAAGSVWEVVDQICAEVADSYHAIEDERLGADDAHAGPALEALLSGCGHELGTMAEVARVLGLPVTGGFAVVVAAQRAGAPPSGVREAVAMLGMASAWHRTPGRLVGVVALSGMSIQSLRRALAAYPQERIGVSAEIDTLADVPQGHLQAGLALATLPGQRTGAVLLDDALPAALVVAQPDLAQRLVQAVLGDVLALPRAERDLLLETARAWLANAGSPSATATTLYCHRNTVLNRLRRIETLTGRPMESTQARVELSLALTALDILPGLEAPLGDTAFPPPHVRLSCTLCTPLMHGARG